MLGDFVMTQIGVTAKGLLANITDIRPIICVYSNVFFQAGASRERFTAKRASKWPLVLMQQNVLV